MFLHSVVNVHQHSGEKLSFTVYIDITLHRIKCSAVVDFAICNQLIKLIHVSIEPEITSDRSK